MQTGPPEKRDTVHELGEFALIDRITRGRVNTPHTVLGPGDDAAVVNAPDGRVVASDRKSTRLNSSHER